MSTTLRVPRGLWNDLEQSIIKQDRQFLSEVARSLGLPLHEVLRKIGPTASTIPVLWQQNDVDPMRCPWYTLRGSLWTRCSRYRLVPTLPCCVHERPGSHYKLMSGLKELERARPVRRGGQLFWVRQDGSALDEAGEEVGGGRFILGLKIARWVPE